MLIGKEWYPESWNGDRWENPDEAGNTEPLNSDESSLPVEEVSLNPSEGINPALFEETVMASPWDSCHVRQCWVSSRSTLTIPVCF